MKLIIAVIAQNREKAIRKALLQKNIRMTRLTSSGGYFKHHNQTFLIGAEDSDVPAIIATIQSLCETEIVKHDSKAYEVHEAVLFVCPLKSQSKF